MSRMKQTFLVLILLLLSPMLSGCFGSNPILGGATQRGTPGGLTLACLDGSQYTSMVVEVDYHPGYVPESSSTDLLKQRLESVCDKPNGIQIQLTESQLAGDGTWSAQDVRDTGWDLKSHDPQDGKVLYWQILFPSGSYDDDSVLGVAVDASTIAIFGDSVDDAAGFFGIRPSSEEVENSVVIHEIGHLLGLVNLVYTSPADHEDAENKGHSNNEESVMYWAVESRTVGSFISGDLPTEFDQDDLNDLSGLGDGSIESSNQLWRP